jgi:hypothetical protein
MIGAARILCSSVKSKKKLLPSIDSGSLLFEHDTELIETLVRRCGSNIALHPNASTSDTHQDNTLHTIHTSTVINIHIQRASSWAAFK